MVLVENLRMLCHRNTKVHGSRSSISYFKTFYIDNRNLDEMTLKDCLPNKIKNFGVCTTGDEPQGLMH